MKQVPAISARGLSFAYQGGRRALDGVDLELPARAWGLLLGPTGAGKSTLVRCLNRAIPLFFRGELSGRVALSGEEIGGWRVPDAARHAGVVFQDFETQIFSTSCLLEVAFAMESRGLPAERIRARARDLLERVGLGGFENRDPSTLSGGEKQRLVIAAVLALEAPLLVLDEPASDLDPGGRAEVYGLIRSLEEKAVLLVEHDLEGLPPTGPGTLLVDGKVRLRWTEGYDAYMPAMSGALERAGVRPPPLARLLALLAERHPRHEPVPPDRLDPASVRSALMATGWRLPDAVPPRPTPATGPEMVVCDRVGFSYPGAGGRHALDDVNFTIRQGEMLAIIGSNGSGKTTLARQIGGLQRPDGGSVLFGGERLAGMPARRRARQVGFVFQNPDHQIFASTVGDEVAFGPRNLGLGAHETDRRVREALDVVGLGSVRSADPFVLTKGERQRLALASVLACEPDMIIMDEPTTGLDLPQQESVMRLLARLNSDGHTIVIITHALWLIRPPVSRVLMMIDGRLAADGSPEEILTSEELMRRAGLRMPDMAVLASLWDGPLLDERELAEVLVPPGRGAS